MAKTSIFDAMVTRDTPRSPFSYEDKTDKQLVAAVLDYMTGQITANKQVDLFDKLKSSTADELNSWVTSDKNLVISAKVLKSALGPEFIKDMHARTKIGQNQIAERLTVLLPQLVEELSPAGELPSMNVLPAMIKSVKQRL
jgi:uncharacterized protein YidB (DUF937 family)